MTIHNPHDVSIHPTALISDSAKIGKGTRIWAFCNIQDNVTIGKNCNICDYCYIEAGVTIGNNVTIKNGVSIWEGVTIKDDVFIGPNVTFTNDIHPRSKRHEDPIAKTTIEKGTTIGANSTLLPVVIGPYAMIGAGSVVTKRVPMNTLCYGNPAKPKGLVTNEGRVVNIR